MARNLAVPTCTRESKIPCLSPAAYYVRRWTLYSNCLLMSKCLWSKWKCFGGLKEIVSQFLSFDSWIFVKEIPDREKKKIPNFMQVKFYEFFNLQKDKHPWKLGNQTHIYKAITKFIFHQNLQCDINPISGNVTILYPLKT